MDLRKLRDYTEFVDKYKDEFLPEVYRGNIKYPAPVNNPNEYNTKVLRCLYCDYLREQYVLKAIIGTFNIPEQPYLPQKFGRNFSEFDIIYTETQMCVFNQDIIVHKQIVKGDD